MTENEIKNTKEWFEDFIETYALSNQETIEFQKAVACLEELQQYRAIGTVEEIQSMKDQLLMVRDMCKDYYAIGTVEEFKALKENSFFNFDSPVVRVDEKSYNKAIDECIRIIEETTWRDTDMLVESIRELKGVQNEIN